MDASPFIPDLVSSTDSDAPLSAGEVLAPRWRALCIAAAIGALVGVAASQVLPRWYQASARLAVMPAHDPSMSASLEAVQSATEMMPMLIAILQSHGLDEETTKTLGLQNAYRARTLAAAVAELHGRIHVTAERKSNLVTVLVDDTVPERARAIAAEVVRAAQTRQNDLWSARSREDRAQLESQLAEVGGALRSAEDTLEQFRAQNRVVDLAQQTRASVDEAAALERMRIEQKLGERFALGFGSGESPEARRSHRARRDLEAELASLTHGTAEHGPLLALDALPALTLKDRRLKRAVELQEARHDVLTHQLATLEAAEARPAGRVEVVDAAATPTKPSRPKPAALGLAGAVLFTLGFALFLLYLSRRREMLLQ